MAVRQPRMDKRATLVLALAVVAAASMWIYVQRVLIPYQVQDAAAHGRPRGLLSDLYPRWVGARDLLLHGRDPYSDEVTREIQLGYYGRVLDSSRPEDPKDEQRFAYPVYVVFLLAPWLQLPFAMVRWVFSVGLGALTVLSVPLWLGVIRWKPKCLTVVALVLLTISSFAAVQGIKLQQLSLLVSALLAICLYSIVRGQLFVAGLCLSLASIKPQLMFLITLWLLLWAVANWRQRQPIVWGLAAGMAVLASAGEIVSAGWIGHFVHGLVAYEQYTGGGSLLDVLAGRLAGSVLALLVVLIVALAGWRYRYCDGASSEFAEVGAFVLATTALVIPMMAPYNHLILLPAVLLIVRNWSGLRRRGRLPRFVAFVAAAVVLWPWPVAIVLSAASFVAPQYVLRFWAAPLWTSLAIPLAIFPLSFALVTRSERPNRGSPEGAALA
jgi:hypothetical protein